VFEYAVHDNAPFEIIRWTKFYYLQTTINMKDQ
jgi:hypothetical protein